MSDHEFEESDAYEDGHPCMTLVSVQLLSLPVCMNIHTYLTASRGPIIYVPMIGSC